MITRRTLWGSLLAAGSAGSVRAEGAPVVVTTSGPVRGYVDNAVAVFKGVRYGDDTRLTRFQPPRPPRPWTAPIDATAYGPACPQAHAPGRTSEDCLFLNVWTPGLGDGAARPVLVYIHGGAYSTGSGSDPATDGARLARRRNAVVITLNHRLNLFGHLYLAPYGAPFEASGGAGVLDLVLALQWVRDNAIAFGGDPACVTVFGQSGGGAKIATLMAMEAAKGLFHRAVTMSGQQLTASGPLHAQERTRAFLSAVGTPEPDAKALLTAPVDRLLKGLQAVDPILGGGLYFGPVLDHAVLSRHPFYPDAPPQSRTIPMMIGNTLDETRYFLGRTDESVYALTWDALPGRLTRELRVDIDPRLVVQAYRQMRPAFSPTEVFFAATTASRSWRAAVVELELRAAQGAPAYAYQLNWRSPAYGGRLGAFHTLDIPLMFDTVRAAAADTGGGADAQTVSDQMTAALLAFARTGAPSEPLAPWPAYRLAERATRVFDVTSRVEADPRGDERRLFSAVPFIQQGT